MKSEKKKKEIPLVSLSTRKQYVNTGVSSDQLDICTSPH